MKKILLWCIFSFLTLFVAAQVINTDSLKNEIDSYHKKDSQLVKKLARYAAGFKQKDPVKAIKLFENAVAAAREIGWQRLLPYMYLDIAGLQSLDEKYDASISSLLTALKIAEDNHLPEPLFDIHFDLSEYYRLLSNFDLAAIHAKRALDIGTNEKDDRRILTGFLIWAQSYANKNKWDSAALLLDKTMELAIRQKSEYIKQQVNSIRADHMIETKDLKGALELYRSNLQFQYKTSNKNGIAWVYSVLAMLYADLNDKDSAHRYADSALAISNRFNLTKELKDAYDALFYCHNKFGNYKKALEYRLLYDSIHLATFNVQAGQKAERARMELEQERRDAETRATSLQKEAQEARTRNLLYAGIMVFALAVLFLFWNNRQKQKAKIKIEKAYSELKDTQQQLIQSEKMASLGELTAGIAHEIQNPLNFVNNFSEVSTELIDEMVEEANKGNTGDVKLIAGDLKQNLEKINHHGKRADAIVKGMLQHSRSSTGVKEPTDINALADEYLRLAYHGLRAKDKSFNATLNHNFDKNIDKINVIPQDIGRVLVNLINNAFYAVNEKTKQHIPGYEPTVTITTKKAGDKAELRIIDNGNGISQKVLDKIFQPFFTTKPTGQGTGLGLSLAYDIITKGHGGELKVETKEARPDDPVGRGEGTCFIIYIPIIK